MTNRKVFVPLLALLLQIDGTIRIIFSTLLFFLVPELFRPFDLYFHLRWFGLGLLELIFAYGVTKRRNWALYALLVLSLIRIYTVIAFPPQGLFLPVYGNLVTYIFKILIVIMVIFLFYRRKDFGFK